MVEQLKLILIAAIDYAVMNNLPLPGDIYLQFFLKGELPSWIKEHLDNETARHHCYYRFALEEYREIVAFLKGEKISYEIPQFPFGQKVLEEMRQRLAAKFGAPISAEVSLNVQSAGDRIDTASDSGKNDIAVSETPSEEQNP